MLDETRRLLILFIGECWHEKPKQPCGWDRKECSEPCNLIENGEKWDTCPHGKKHYTHWVYPDRNRSFTGPQDAQAVKDKLVEKGLWRSFEDYINSIWVENEWKPFALNHHAGGKSQCKTVMQWLWSYTRDSAGNITGYRLCELVGEFLKGRNG